MPQAVGGLSQGDTLSDALMNKNGTLRALVTKGHLQLPTKAVSQQREATSCSFKTAVAAQPSGVCNTYLRDSQVTGIPAGLQEELLVVVLLCPQ